MCLISKSGHLLLTQYFILALDTMRHASMLHPLEQHIPLCYLSLQTFLLAPCYFFISFSDLCFVFVFIGFTKTLVIVQLFLQRKYFSNKTFIQTNIYFESKRCTVCIDTILQVVKDTGQLSTSTEDCHKLSNN